jgi:hypothetical protein
LAKLIISIIIISIISIFGFISIIPYLCTLLNTYRAFTFYLLPFTL